MSTSMNQILMCCPVLSSMILQGSLLAFLLELSHFQFLNLEKMTCFLVLKIHQEFTVVVH